MISLQVIFIIIVVHFLADFALQTQQQAIEKSRNDNQLGYHVLTYTGIWLFISFAILGTWWKPLIFALLTFTTHFPLDYYSSRIVKKFREKEDWHNMFVVIGADQVLHYIQLFVTYWILK